jgi:hypothetical protein
VHHDRHAGRIGDLARLLHHREVLRQVAVPAPDSNLDAEDQIAICLDGADRGLCVDQARVHVDLVEAASCG